MSSDPGPFSDSSASNEFSPTDFGAAEIVPGEFAAGEMQPDAGMSGPAPQTYAPAAGAPVAAKEEGPKKPRFDTYTAMLLAAMLCMMVACAVLCIEINRYGGEYGLNKKWPLWPF